MADANARPICPDAVFNRNAMEEFDGIRECMQLVSIECVDFERWAASYPAGGVGEFLSNQGSMEWLRCRNRHRRKSWRALMPLTVMSLAGTRVRFDSSSAVFLQVTLLQGESIGRRAVVGHSRCANGAAAHRHRVLSRSTGVSRLRPWMPCNRAGCSNLTNLQPNEPPSRPCLPKIVGNAGMRHRC